MYASETDRTRPRKENPEEENTQAVFPLKTCGLPHAEQDAAAVALIERALSGISQ